MEKQMEKFKIVADSAADLFALDSVPFAVAPMKVITDEAEYVDDAALDVAEMTCRLKAYKGRSTSSCPNTDEWLRAFGDGQYVFAVTITSGLSGSFNAAQVAKQLYEDEYPDRRVFVLDSLSAGPEQTLLVEKLRELILAGLEFDEICRQIAQYREKTGLLFILQSLTNFANNGRVSPAVAKIAGLLGINIVGRASLEGTLEPVDKVRGMKKALDTMVKRLQEAGYGGGKLLISHCFNEPAVLELKSKLQALFSQADIRIHTAKGLCSFYAELGGLLVGYET